MTEPLETHDGAPLFGLPRASRRTVVATAAKLAIAAPLALTALPRLAAAKDDSGEDDDGNNRGRGRAFPPGLFQNQLDRRGAFMLVPVSAVNGGSGGADFSATSAGSDVLAAGAIFLAANRQAVLMLRGVAASATYEVFYERFQDHGREDLGAITTDASGNFNGAAPNGLGGANRVGVFVVSRSGSDEFVSTTA